MKYLFFLLLFICLKGFSQDTTTVSITLKEKYHAYIYALSPDKGDVDMQKYSNQVASAMVLVNGQADTSQLITVRVKKSLVTSRWIVIGSQQERITSDYNAAIKAALQPQLPPDLLQAIGAIGQNNSNDTWTVVSQGNKDLLRLKQ